MKIRLHEPSGAWTKRGRLFAGLLPVLAMGFLLSSVGCSSFSQGVIAPYSQSGCRLCTDIKARATAMSLWRSKYAHCYGSAANAKDIRKGFVDGFIETAAGGNGCTPLVPPSSCCGIGKRLNAKAWFQGYPLGVVAAQSTGACNWCKTAISPDLAACMSTNQCTPGCVPCSQNAGVMHSGMVHDSYNAPPVPAGMPVPMIDDPNGSTTEGFPTPAEVNTDGSVDSGENWEAESTVDTTGEITDSAPGDVSEAMSDEATDVLELPTGESEQLSPSDRESIAPPAPIEVLAPENDDLTVIETQPETTVAAKPTDVAAAKAIPVASPRQETPIVGQPITMPTIEDTLEKARATAKQVADDLTPETPVSIDTDVTVPIVGEPVDLPNIQVSFDMEGVDWLFGEVDIAQAVLAQQIEGSL